MPVMPCAVSGSYNVCEPLEAQRIHRSNVFVAHFRTLTVVLVCLLIFLSGPFWPVVSQRVNHQLVRLANLTLVLLVSPPNSLLRDLQCSRLNNQQPGQQLSHHSSPQDSQLRRFERFYLSIICNK